MPADTPDHDTGAESAPGTENAKGDSGATSLPRPMWLLSETRRSFISTAIAAILMMVSQRWLIRSYEPLRDLARTDRLAAVLLLAVLVWASYALAHTVMTSWAFGGLRGADFTRAIEADPSWRRYEQRRDNRWHRWVLGIGPATWSIWIALASLASVIALVLRPALREVPLALAVALLLVAVSWVSVALIFALHYARVNDRRPGLGFPGEQPDRLTDYLYLAVGVQATFGTTDVDVTTHELRTQIMTQSLVAFVFNTVIVGMVVSLLLSLG